VSTHEKSLGHTGIHGAVVVGVSQAVKLGTQTLSVAILARLLTPEDFGVVAAVAPVTALVILFQDFGLQQAIVQRREISQEQLSPAFWFTLSLGLGCGVLLASLAPAVAAFYGDGRLLALTIATAPSIVIASAGSIPVALLNRKLRFKTLAIIETVSALTVFGVAIAAAWSGAQYWALIVGTFAGNVVIFFGAWYSAGWRPSRPALRLPERVMLRFGANLVGFGLVNFLARNLDNVLIGCFSGAVALGYYDRAYKLLLLPLYNVNAPLSRVTVPLLSRIESDKPRLRNAFLKIASQVGLVTIPGMAALVATSGETVEVLFGPGWQPVAPIFAWLGLAGLVQPITWAVTWLLVAQGRTATMFRWGAYASSTAVLSFAIGLRWGAVGVACAYAVGEYVLRLPVVYLTVQRVGPVTASDLVKLQGSLLAAAGLTVLISNEILRPYALSGIYLVAATVALSYGLAAGFLALVPWSRAAMQETFSLRPLRMVAPVVTPVVAGAAVLRRGSWRMFSRARSSEDPRPGKCLQAAADQNHFSKPSK
jgi:O-antigen/teichoic acid export membrane protein